MTTAPKLCIAIIALASRALAANVNITVETSQVAANRITEVQVDGGGLHQFADPLNAPALTEPQIAIAAALTALGYPLGTSATVVSTTPIGNDERFQEIVTSNYNPVDNPDFVIGDPDDYLTWIATGNEDVFVHAEQITTTYTFYRLVAALAATCGDGTLQPGEACDDANTNDGDCCSSSCEFDGAGSACSDGVACTALDTCDGAGTCRPGGPATTCATAWAKAKLSINETKPGKEKLTAALSGGPALAQSDFGHPDSGATVYDICLFDDGGHLAASFRVDRAGDTCAGKPCWKANKETGWKYQDKTAASDGITKMLVAGGAAGKSKIQLQAANNAKKEQLAMPTGIAAALQSATNVTLQVRASDAQCFSVLIDEIKKQEADAFKGAK